MPRPRVDDKLLAHQFHLLDVDFSISVPPWVFTPSAGFQSISAPEMTINVHEINEGTALFMRHVLGKMRSSGMVLQRGVSPFNSDFWRWTVSCLEGRKHLQTNLLEFTEGGLNASRSNVEMPGSL